MKETASLSALILKNKISSSLKRKSIFLLFYLTFFFSHGSARDINLDEIYIKKSSEDLKKLIIEKIDTYQKIGAIFVDRSVIFADWISGREIVYIKERPSYNTNVISVFQPGSRKSVDLCGLDGVITVAKLTANGRYLIIKRLILRDSIVPRGETVIIRIKPLKISIRDSAYAFIDFTVESEGSLALLEEKNNIIELNLDTGTSRKILNKKIYKDIVISENPTIAHLSPDRKKILLVNGSGGNYKSKLYWNNNFTDINGISSSAEIFWTGNFTIAYRKGYAGNYSAVLHDIRSNKIIVLLNKSFNTNIIFSKNTDIVSFLNEQVICIYDQTKKNVVTTGLEGEDISFAPNGNDFVSLIYKKLFIVNLETLNKKQIELKRSWKSIYSVYNDLRHKTIDFENSFSKQYIDRKIQVYKGLADI